MRVGCVLLLLGTAVVVDGDSVFLGEMRGGDGDKDEDGSSDFGSPVYVGLLDGGELQSVRPSFLVCLDFLLEMIPLQFVGVLGTDFLSSLLVLRLSPLPPLPLAGGGENCILLAPE